MLTLMAAYGFALFTASNMLADGSELLLLVPSLEGLVGSVVLPIVGVVPDAMIMLFSRLGEKEEAQETLSVGVGELAGSTIMLVTVPWGAAIIAGRVALGADGEARYTPHCTQYKSTLHPIHAVLHPIHTTLHPIHTKLHPMHTTLDPTHTTLHQMHTTLHPIHTTLHPMLTTLDPIHTTLHYPGTACARALPRAVGRACCLARWREAREAAAHCTRRALLPRGPSRPTPTLCWVHA